MTVEPIEPTRGFCGAIAAQCVCSLPPDHEGEPHTCTNPTVFDGEPCGGQWFGDIDGLDFQIVTVPAASSAFSALYGPLFGGLLGEEW